MLYLDDILEMIEHLPQELRDRFTNLREMDLQVQNASESLEKRVKIFFSKANDMEPHEREAEYNAIKKDYSKAVEEANEKVTLANQMHDMISMYLRKLDQECHTFKMELEADYAGITEMLEKRSEEMDVSNASCQKENQYSMILNQLNPASSERKRDQVNSDFKRLMATEKMLNDVHPMVPMSEPLTTPSTVSYGLSYPGVGGTAIAAAATQAIVATQQMQQGRRTASLKASYEAIGGISMSHSNKLGAIKELAGAAQTALATIKVTNKKQKKKTASSSGVPTSSVTLNSQELIQTPVESSTNRNGSSCSANDNEPRYCICNEVAYGGMVACDNNDCLYEWFHYPCVGITDPPKGSWYCPQCLAAKKRKNVSRKKKGHSSKPEDNQKHGLRHSIS